MTRTKKEILSHVSDQIISSKKVENNTVKIVYENGNVAYRLHDTDVVTLNKDGNFTLNSGGWRTVTTKDRINRFSPARIYQNKGNWYIGEDLFKDGMVIDVTGKVISGAGKENRNQEKILKQIDKFCKLITKDNLPQPSNGDCWECLLVDKDGKTMGDLFGNTEHLMMHMKEKYLHGSLLVNAMKDMGYRDMQIGVHYHMKMYETFRRAVRKYLRRKLLPEMAR